MSVPARQRSSSSGMSSGGSWRSPSIITTASPVAWSSAAVVEGGARRRCDADRRAPSLDLRLPVTRSMVAAVQARALEPEVRRVGAELAAAFPSPARHPMRALDDKAMEVSARDEALRAALFRFVDVAPACRSLDDLAGHLTGYLDELPERPVPLRTAMRMAHTRTGRTALGAAAAAGVKHMAHRFIVGETPRAVTGELRSLWQHGVAASVD